jgi:Ni,Fe-hydrogenase III large subunit
MAELERIANHLGDFGAICNDASFSILHAQCGMLRELALARRERLLRSPLMMDRVVPGGRPAADQTAEGVSHLRALIDAIRRRFPELVEVYDNTASLQDRTVTTGILKGELARQFGAGGYVGRASGRAIDVRPHARLSALTTRCSSRCRCSRKATSMRASGSASARSSKVSA